MNLLPQNLELLDLIPALAIITGGLIIGLIIQIIILVRIRQLFKKTKFTYDDRLVNSLGNSPIIYSLLAAIYIASFTLDIPQDGLNLLKQFLIVISLVELTIIVSRISGISVEVYLRKVSGDSSASLFTNAARILVYIVGFLIISQTLGINITAALTALGVGGLAVALALQDTLTNLFAGFYIIAARKIKPGDYIELESGQEGFVEDVSWRNTTIRTLQNYIIIVPNATLANVILTNYQLPVSDLAILMNVGVSYDSDLELVEKVTVEVAKEVMVEVAGAVPEFDPFIRYNDFAASSINFTVIMRGKQYTDRYLINHEFVKRLHKRYAKEGVEFPFPQLDLTIKNKEITVKQK